MITKHAPEGRYFYRYTFKMIHLARTVFRKIRLYQYNATLHVSLFAILPLILKMPVTLQKVFLSIRSYLRYRIGSYQAYINRADLKKSTVRNIMNTLGLEQDIAEKIFRNLMHLEVMIERNSLLLDRFTPEDLSRMIKLEGIGILLEASRKKRGIILPSIHSGDSMIFMLLLHYLGYNIHGLFDSSFIKKKRLSPSERFALLKDRKITSKIGKLYAGSAGLKKVISVLKGGGVVVWMVDLPPGQTKRARTVNFLNCDVSVGTTFWEAARISGASIVPYTMAYNASCDTFTVRFLREFLPTRDSIEDLFSEFETFIINNPDSWIGWYIFDLLKQ